MVAPGRTIEEVGDRLDGDVFRDDAFAAYGASAAAATFEHSGRLRPLRATGMFGEDIAVPVGPGAQTQHLAFIGRQD